MTNFKCNNVDLTFTGLLVVFAERQAAGKYIAPYDAIDIFEERLMAYCDESASEQGCYYEADFDFESYTDKQRENLDARQISMLVRYY